MNIDTAALLATARDALAVPSAATAWGQQRRDEVKLARATAVQRALDYALATDDQAGAVEMVEEAIAAHPVPYVCACDLEEVPSLADLKRWASVHDTSVRCLGATLEGLAVYGATKGPITRVTITDHPGPHPVVWKSPLAAVPAPRAETRTPAPAVPAAS
ncbi:hypothetical protein ACFXKD_27930 [Nocardiopsis aegyptia]|uniref:hypothetical protein n=1 Tax=Nocardiopsis aegyptia TaxID=220378 RepID=UPI003670B119